MTAQVYADGARRGAPRAVQVADRFHLLKNLGEALERCLLHERPSLQAAVALEDSCSPPPETDDAKALVPSQARAETESQQKLAPKRAQYEQVVQLHAAGATIQHIAERVDISRPTVYRYLSLDGPPDRRRPHRSRRLLIPYESYLRRRWAERCQTTAVLLRELRAQGYTHSARNVYRFLKQVAQARIDPQGSPIPRQAIPSPRHVASLLVQSPERLTEADRAYLRRLCQQAPVIASAYVLVQEFTAMLRERAGQRLDAWMAQAQASGVKELSAYAQGLAADYAAAKAGLQEPWSNGQTGGQVNRLKLLKRQMYGRANFDLRRLRVLHTA